MSRSVRDGRGLIQLVAVAALVIGAVAAMSTASDSKASAATSESFVPLTPARVLNTRGGAKVGNAEGTGAPYVLRVLGQGGVPASGVGAVALNVTVTQTENPTIGGGYVTVYPCGTRPDASNLNFVGGQTIPNSVIAPVSANGDVCFYVYGIAHLLADVSGYFPAAQSMPPAIPPVRQVISAGTGLSCAITQDTAVWCWGQNDAGALGIGTTQDSWIPVKVNGLTNIIAVDVGGNYVCASDALGSVWCWGQNYGGQLGDGTLEDSLVPKRVNGIPPVADIEATNGGQTCVLTMAAKVWCWGLGSTPHEVAPTLRYGGHPVQLTGEAGHFCVLDSTGHVYCWGANDRMQLGAVGTQIRSATVNLEQAHTVVAGAAFNCALFVDTTARCWGNNAQGQLGNDSGVPSATPLPFPALTGTSRLAGGAGFGHMCAWTPGGAPSCWGVGSSGELGNGQIQQSSSSPVAVVGLSAVAEVSAGFGHTCAADMSGVAWCWGFNFSGQLGDGSNSNTEGPVRVTGLPPVSN